MTMTDTALFDLGVGFDTARAGRSDPVASHMAADVSQHSRALIKSRVLLLVRQEQEINGRELNKLYQARADREGWDEVSYESPRKRAEELLRDGLLVASNEDAAVPGGRIYSIPR